jgi:hypothetical protein
MVAIILKKMGETPKRKAIYNILAKLAFELATIIAGILIALFVNDMQERNRDREILTATLNSLALEFDKNVDNMKRIQPILERFRDTLNYYAKDPNLSISDLTAKAIGLTTADLFTTNWQATLSSNSLRLLNFETVTQLSQIDAKHKELRDQNETLNAIVYSPALYKKGQEGVGYRKVLGDWLGAYLGNERELIILYDQFKDSVNSYKLK